MFTNLWVLLAADFVVQEPITSSALLLSAYQAHYNLWLIHILFLSATALDASAGYWVGMILRDRFPESRLQKWLALRGKRFEKIVGAYGKRVALLVWGPIFFPYSAFVAPWLGYSFLENLVLSLVGDTILWYGGVWALVLGINFFVPNPLEILFISVGIALLLFFTVKYLVGYRDTI